MLIALRQTPLAYNKFVTNILLGPTSKKCNVFIKQCNTLPNNKHTFVAQGGRHVFCMLLFNKKPKMQNKLLTKTTISINASPKQVWHALTSPALIKKYLMGTDVSTTWKEGSPINYTGEYKGKKYHDKGIIKKINPLHLLQTTYLSSMSGKEDKPKNYKLITYTLKKSNHKTILTLTQDNNADEEEKEDSTQNWKAVLKKLKIVVETEEYEMELLA